MSPTIWIDMDGVLTNWCRGAFPLFNVEYPVKAFLGFDYILGQAGITVEELFAKIEKTPDFWYKLPATPWADHLVSWLIEEVYNWRILTTASEDPDCWGQKARWVKDRWGVPGLKRLTVVCGGKAHVCKPGDILVDDFDQNCRKWAEVGGRFFHWLEYTDDHPDNGVQFDKLKQYLTTYGR